MSDIIKKVIDLVNITHDKRVFLEQPDFELFMGTISPLYQKKYGALVGDDDTVKEGYLNILFLGKAVCLKEVEK